MTTPHISALETVLEKSETIKDLTAMSPKDFSHALAAEVERRPEARYVSVAIEPKPELDFDTVYSLAVESFYPEYKNRFLCPMQPTYAAEMVHKYTNRAAENTLQYSKIDTYFYADNQRWNPLPMSAESPENQIETVVGSLVQASVFNEMGDACVDCRSMSTPSENLICVVTKTSIPNAYLAITMRFDENGIVTELTPILVFDRNPKN